MKSNSLQSKESSDLVFDLLDVLQSPIITYSVMWADTIPDRLMKVIPLARTMAALKKDHMATEEEVVAYIMTRTLEAPMTSEWTNIYTYLGCKVCERHWGTETQGIAPESLTRYEEHELLRPLRLWIYEKRRAVFKQRLKAEQKTTKPEPAKSTPIIISLGEQLNLF